MAQNLLVTCINKRDHYNEHERIQAIGGAGWKHLESVAISNIEAGIYNYYVSVGGRTVWVRIATHEGRKYLKTQDDGYAPNNLLSLGECR